jgi:hypothetical protein
MQSSNRRRFLRVVMLRLRGASHRPFPVALVWRDATVMDEDHHRTLDRKEDFPRIEQF